MNIDIDKIKIIKMIGRGMYGTIYLCKYKQKFFAYKIEHILEQDIHNKKSNIWKEINFSIKFANKYQEQLTENLKSLKTLSDKTLTSVSSMRDAINTIDKDTNENTVSTVPSIQNEDNIKLSNNNIDKDTSNNENKRTPLNTKTVKNSDPLDIVKFSKAIGIEVSSRLIPSFDKLGKTFTDGIEYAVDTLSEILRNNQSNSTTLAGAPGRGRVGSGPAPTPRSGSLPSAAGAPAAAALPALSNALPLATAATSLLAAPILLSAMDDPKDLDRMREKEKAEKEAKKKADAAKPNRQTQGKLEALKQIEPGEIIPFNGIDYTKQPDGTLADKTGKILPSDIQKTLEDTYLRFLNKKGATTKDIQNRVGESFEKLDPTVTFDDLKNKPRSMQSNNTENKDNEKPRGGRGGAAAGQKEDYERLKRAEKLPDEVMTWAEKRYKDPNMREPGYLAEPKNSEILKWLEQNQDYIKRNPNYNLNKKEESTPKNVKPKSEKVSQNLDAQPMASILKGAETESAVLSENNSMNNAPIVVNNNTTVASTGSGSGMSFVSGSPVNTNTAINDFFRYNGRIFA